MRIRRLRARGWEMPDAAIYVGRPTAWGNPYQVGKASTHVDGESYLVADPAMAVQLHREHLEHWTARLPGLLDDLQAALAWRDLACRCPIDAPCHADTLIEWANTPAPTLTAYWRTMRSAPKTGIEIEILIRHCNYRYCTSDEQRAQWQAECRAHWIDFNGGGWVWRGLCGEQIGWRPLPAPEFRGDGRLYGRRPCTDGLCIKR